MMDEKTRIELAEQRSRKEPLITALDGKEMWYHEQRIQIPGRLEVECDEWGANVLLHSDHTPKTINLSGRWDILTVRRDGFGALYCSWSVSEDCYYPEMGICPP